MRKQCAKCPWKVSVDPHDIPNGYSPELHRALKDTIAEEGVIGELKVMACHDSKPDGERI